MGLRLSPYAVLLVLVGTVSLLQLFPQLTGTAQLVPEDILPPPTTVTVIIPEPIYVTRYQTTTLTNFETTGVTIISMTTYVSRESNIVSQTSTQTFTYTQPLSPLQENSSLIVAGTAIAGTAVGYALSRPGRKKWSKGNRCPTCRGTGSTPYSLPIQPGTPSGPPSFGPGQAPRIGPGIQSLATPISLGSPVVPFLAPVGLRKCASCGRGIRLGVQFCPNCGIKVERSGAP